MISVWCLRLAAVSGFLVVALGAFGAHGFKNLLQTHQTTSAWDTAVFYHALHTLVLLAVAFHPALAKGMAISFVCGIILFSGSLYILALTNIRWLGAITPLGGVGFLIGWGWLFLTAGAKAQG